MNIPRVRLAYDLASEKKYVERAINKLTKNGIKGRHILVYALFNWTESPEEYLRRIIDILRWGVVCYPMQFQPCDTLEKNKYISPRWKKEQIDLLQSARRVIGYGGAFPPYKGSINKLGNDINFEEAFSLYPVNRTKKL